MGSSVTLKPLVWVGGSKADLMAMPASVIDTFGFGLYLAQSGGKHPQAKVLRGFGSAGVLEIVEDWRGNTYRAVYTVQIGAVVYVLHVFQKKAARGISTPKPDLDLIKDRLKAARRAVGKMR